MNFHHLGIACEDIRKVQNYLASLYTVKEISPVIYDENQLAYLCMVTLENDIRLELISGKVVEGYIQKNISLYHICYEVDNLEHNIKLHREQGCFIVSPPKNAILFGGRRVAFLSTPIGLVELLEKEKC